MITEIKTLAERIKDSNLNPTTYAVIAVDGDDAIFMFSGETDIILGLLPTLERQIKTAVDNNKDLIH